MGIKGGVCVWSVSVRMNDLFWAAREELPRNSGTAPTLRTEFCVYINTSTILATLLHSCRPHSLTAEWNCYTLFDSLTLIIFLQHNIAASISVLLSPSIHLVTVSDVWGYKSSQPSSWPRASSSQASVVGAYVTQFTCAAAELEIRSSKHCVTLLTVSTSSCSTR